MTVQEALNRADALLNEYVKSPSAAKLPGLREAIDLYGAVLNVLDENAYPETWAVTMNNLATAYSNLPTGDRAENLRRAIACYAAALRVQTPEQLPVDCLRTLHNLGSLYFGQGDWQNALAASLQAVETTEQIRWVALSETERRRVFQEAHVVFERAILCSLRTAKYDLALTLIERGKSRNLADHLWQREIKPNGVLEEAWKTYQGRLMIAREIERILSTPSSSGMAPSDRAGAVPVRETLDQLRALRQEISECEARFREADPNYLPFARPLELKEIGALASAADSVLIVFRVTQEGSYLFLLGPKEKEITPDQVVSLREFGDEALGRMLIETENGAPTGGWLVKYELFRTGQLSSWEWLACVEETTRALYERLLTPLHQRLQARYPEARRLILIPNKGLNLLPLHAGWWEENGERRALLDDYEISYAPSCQVLKRCLSREPAYGAPAANLFAVQNPDGTLPFPDWEVEEVSKFFGDEHQLILRGPEATEEGVKERMTFGEEKLFSCHGVFDLNDVEQSRLELHGGGRLSVRDIVPIDLKGTWLVVMSACETGLTDHRDLIDEYQGFPSAFLVAGGGDGDPLPLGGR
jgi:tetratricopeptide (TPR) repeat protein